MSEILSLKSEFWKLKFKIKMAAKKNITTIPINLSQ